MWPYRLDEAVYVISNVLLQNMNSVKNTTSLSNPAGYVLHFMQNVG